MNLEILNQNLKGTNWSNARLEDGKLLATHTGEMRWPEKSGNIAIYNGITDCVINPSKVLYASVEDYGFDQNGWVNKNLEWAPVGREINF